MKNLNEGKNTESRKRVLPSKEKTKSKKEKKQEPKTDSHRNSPAPTVQILEAQSKVYASDVWQAEVVLLVHQQAFHLSEYRTE